SQTHILLVPEPRIRLRPTLRVSAYLGRLIALRQRREDRCSRRGRHLQSSRLQALVELLLESIPALVYLVRLQRPQRSGDALLQGSPLLDLLLPGSPLLPLPRS